MKRIVACDTCEFDKALPFAISEGLGMELQSFYDPNHEDQFPAWIKQQQEQGANLPFRSMHGAFGDLNCGSFDPLVREISRQRMHEGYQIALQVNASDIVFHHGYVPRTSPPANWIPRFIEFWKNFLVDKTGEIRFHLENFLELTPDMMIETIDNISDPRVDACLDVGHCHCNTTTPTVEWIEKLGKRIGYVHLHDNDKSRDQHLAIGKGTIPFKEACGALNEYAPDAVWAMEVNPEDLQESYQWLRENGFAAQTKK